MTEPTRRKSDKYARPYSVIAPSVVKCRTGKGRHALEQNQIMFSDMNHLTSGNVETITNTRMGIRILRRKQHLDALVPWGLSTANLYRPDHESNC